MRVLKVGRLLFKERFLFEETGTYSEQCTHDLTTMKNFNEFCILLALLTENSLPPLNKKEEMVNCYGYQCTAQNTGLEKVHYPLE